MPILLAEDLLLLLLDDQRGDLPVRGPATAGGGGADVGVLAAEIVLGGALLIELELGRAVALRGGTPGLPWEVVLTPTAYAPGGPGDEPVLRAALQRVEQLPWEPHDLVQRIGEGLPAVLAGRLVERGLVVPVVDGGPGIFGQVRWPAAETAREQDVRRRILDVLVAGVAPDPRSRALISLLTGAHLLELVVPASLLPMPEAYRRGALVTGESWPTTAMQRAAARLVPPTPAAPAEVPQQQVAEPEGPTFAAIAGDLIGTMAGSFLAGMMRPAPHHHHDDDRHHRH
jgi:hypothetical protein